MILVVIVTVLLAVVGVMFVMVARVGEMETSAVIDSGDLNTAVESVVDRVHTVLVEDLFGTDERMLNGDADSVHPGADEREDFSRQWGIPIGPGNNGTIDWTSAQVPNNDDVWLPGTGDDIWLASLEPEYKGPGPDTKVGTSDDIYDWPRVTDLWGTLQGRPDSLYYQQYSSKDHAAIYSTNALRKQWIDPDDTSNATHLTEGWTAGLWNKWQVSAKDVRAKVIVPGERTGVVAVGTDTDANTNLVLDADKAPGTQAYPDPWGNATWVSLYGARADADGDGVADSRWVKIPNLTTSRGKPVLAAVRIIDNCAMLNLNTAHCFYQDPTIVAANPNTSPFAKVWYPTRNLFQTQPVLGKYASEGRFLTEVNYRSWLRGADLTAPAPNPAPYDQNWYRLQIARGLWNLVNGVPLTPEQSHNVILNNIDNAMLPYTFFDIGDELEMRNRYLMTSRAETRFERNDVANYTFNAGGSLYAVLETPIDTDNDFRRMWKIRIDPRNFNEFSGAFVGTDSGQLVNPVNYQYRYDRRHVSTFYSFDRPLRLGQYASLETALAAELALLQNNAALSDAQRKTAMRAIESVFRLLDNHPLDLRTMTDPTNADRITANTLGARKNILHLLYAFQAFYMDKGLTQAVAAKKSAQIVANLIDYLDDDTADGVTLDTQNPFYGPDYKGQRRQDPTSLTGNLTYIDREIVRQLIIEVSKALPASNNIATIDIGATVPATPNPYEFGLGVTVATETVYGFERQPFISDLYCQYLLESDGSKAFAVELINPYTSPLNLTKWQIRIGATKYSLPATAIVPAAVGATVGRLTLWAADSGFDVVRTDLDPTSTSVYIAGFRLGTMNDKQSFELERPDPQNAGQFIVVDHIDQPDLTQLIWNNVFRSIKRDDTQWRFANAAAFQGVQLTQPSDSTLGRSNGVPMSNARGYQLPVANDGVSISRLADFEKVAFVSNEKGAATPKTITQQVAAAAAESDIRYDVANDPELLDYICFLNRPKGSLPGRININTAAKHVIAAAIPPQLVMAVPADTDNALSVAQQIVANRPYERVSDLLTKVPAFGKYKNHLTVDVGDQLIRNDIEERDWILSRLSNIFTVRSDVFTAYLLVRLGEDGPERRMIAIFDRSQCWAPTDRPRLVALHPVPDPR